MATSTKTNPSLWKKIVSQVKSGSKGGNAGQWSGRKAQLAVKKYKAAGGGYKGSKSSKNSLSKKGTLPSIPHAANDLFALKQS